MSVEGEIIPGLLGIIYLQIESLSTRFSPRNIVLNTSSFIRSYFFWYFSINMHMLGDKLSS